MGGGRSEIQELEYIYILQYSNTRRLDDKRGALLYPFGKLELWHKQRDNATAGGTPKRENQNALQYLFIWLLDLVVKPTCDYRGSPCSHSSECVNPILRWFEGLLIRISSFGTLCVVGRRSTRSCITRTRLVFQTTLSRFRDKLLFFHSLYFLASLSLDPRNMSVRMEWNAQVVGPRRLRVHNSLQFFDWLDENKTRPIGRSALLSI